MCIRDSSTTAPHKCTSHDAQSIQAASIHKLPSLPPLKKLISYFIYTHLRKDKLNRIRFSYLLSSYLLSFREQNFWLTLLGQQYSQLLPPTSPLHCTVLCLFISNYMQYKTRLNQGTSFLTIPKKSKSIDHTFRFTVRFTFIFDHVVLCGKNWMYQFALLPS